MSDHRAAPAVTAALDRARDDEIVVVRGERVSLMTFDDVAPVIREAWSARGIVPLPWPSRWLLEEHEGELTIHEFCARADRSVA